MFHNYIWFNFILACHETLIAMWIIIVWQLVLYRFWRFHMVKWLISVWFEAATLDITQYMKITWNFFSFQQTRFMDKVRFVNWSDCNQTKISTACIKHFKDEYIKTRKKWNRNRKMQPDSTIFTDKTFKRPSTFPSDGLPKRAPKQRIYQADKNKSFWLWRHLMIWPFTHHLVTCAKNQTQKCIFIICF